MSKKTDKENLPNLFVGQVLYYQIKRDNNEIPIAEAKVVKVGRDYFYAEIGHRQVQFYKANMLSTNARIKLYTSKQYIIDEIDFDYISSRIRRHFSWDGAYSKNTPDQLRQVAKILGIEYPEIV